MERLVVLACILLLSIMAFMSGVDEAKKTTVPRQALIDRGLALYCADTGEFAFIGECGE